MKILSVLLCVTMTLLAGCQTNVEPTNSEISPVDSVNGYRLTYIISPSDSLKIQFSFLNADTSGYTEFAIQFGDSTLSHVFISDTTLEHRYDWRTEYTVTLLGRTEASQPWLQIQSFVLNLKGWHPNLNQLIACRRVEFRVLGEFDVSTNFIPHQRDTATITASYNLSHLNGALLSRNYSSETQFTKHSETVRIFILDSGARLTATNDYYDSYVEESGGYGERNTLWQSLTSLEFLTEDSARYVYHLSGNLARDRVNSYYRFESRFSIRNLSLITDSVTPVGEVIFYK